MVDLALLAEYNSSLSFNMNDIKVLNKKDLVAYAKANGEPEMISGKQELYEAIVNMYI
jgi:xylose isomerase